MARGQGVNQDLSKVLNELWTLDYNRLKPGTDYAISLQGQAGYVRRGSNQASDHAHASLFSYVNEQKLKSIATYAHFINLLDNYEMSTGTAETVTRQEMAENHLFLDAILQTEVMKHAHRYLVSRRLSPADPLKFKEQLYDIWFRLYHRDRQGGEDSCGFEHVFVGETRHGAEIMGFHNWVQFYLQEKCNHVDYKGYKARDRKSTPDEDDHVLNLQFSWKGLVKPVGSSFIGVSPEFEVALFTIVFLMSNERVTNAIVQVDEYHLEVVVTRHGRSIGTSYPKLLSSNNRPL
ncbi:uridylate-specific endoribonuclease C-like [Anguilla rostrata]|uniref:uridylate-specific endoribonuclease C-like n=1 Tax=Anguilla rostrata TaxID=7938 RepID=UPI0030D40D7A